MESFEVSQVSKFAECVATDERCYGHICENHRGLVPRNMKFLLTMFDLQKEAEYKVSARADSGSDLILSFVGSFVGLFNCPSLTYSTTHSIKCYLTAVVL